MGNQPDDRDQAAAAETRPLKTGHFKESFSGRELGSYRVLTRLGQGGMGIIYAAEHVRLGRRVAIKVLRREGADSPNEIKRFFIEARAVNDIGHPNIVDIIDFVEDYECTPPLVYMVMELLEGENLFTRLSLEGPLEPGPAVAITRQVAEALVAVHKVRILHRDLKPENVFLLKQSGQPEAGDDPRIKLLDFGVAKVLDSDREKRLTDPGTAMGTPEYMAPEQILDRPLDARTDIYALGSVLFEMLTGATPFAGKTPGELMFLQVKKPAPPVNQRRGDLPPVPAALEALVARCLEKDPKRRFSNCRALIEALNRCLDAPAKVVVDAAAHEAPVETPAAVAAHEAPAPSLDADLETRTEELKQIVAGPPWRLPVAALVALLILLILISLGLLLWPRGEPSMNKPAAGGPAPDSGPPPAAVTRGPDQGAPDAVMAPRPATASPPEVKTPPAKKNPTPAKKRPRPRRKVEPIHGTIDPFTK